MPDRSRKRLKEIGCTYGRRDDGPARNRRALETSAEFNHRAYLCTETTSFPPGPANPGQTLVKAPIEPSEATRLASALISPARGAD